MGSSVVERPLRSTLRAIFSASERDYKKPKPEDELNTGLYGKIEF